ncbi:histidine phosphatase family protein [Paenactinomyces guangxiensis]|uniref:Histidine phosphatase family protein n=1 Tax=Paenactinomyces guangxiensis TaxID=1490290 RepID=A0A7W1WNA4_9BACL|nr:histidine phosphatase family protein [Paenactinomyces guangxiensis]MBA4492854.1 histidine phosphatase family protein [Paenactinomyces guangxiensis]MBH8590297.1 histidine phosphatase family protein [Paenactinomyces guangxiensis]
MRTHLYFIRHGETVWNREGRVQGHSDIPLSETGLEQARRLAEYLQQQSVSVIYSSDLLRARQTAESIAAKHGVQVQVTSAFRERYGGEWEGLTGAELKEKYPDWETVRFTGGSYGIESTEELQQRIIRELEKIVDKHQGQHIYVVSHGMSINAALTFLTRGEHGTGIIRLHNTSITHLTYEQADGWKLHKINETPHLVVKEEK